MIPKKLCGLCINFTDGQRKLMFPSEKDLLTFFPDCCYKVINMHDCSDNPMTVTLAGRDRRHVLERSDVKNKDFILIAVDLDKPEDLEKVIEKFRPMKKYSNIPFYFICTTKKPEKVDMPSVLKASKISDGVAIVDVVNLRITGKAGKAFEKLRNFNEFPPDEGLRAAALEDTEDEMNNQNWFDTIIFEPILECIDNQIVMDKMNYVRPDSAAAKKISEEENKQNSCSSIFRKFGF